MLNQTIVHKFIIWTEADRPIGRGDSTTQELGALFNL